MRGFYHNCGFNSSGMMLGAGCGWQMAEWIVHGRPSLDMYGFDIRSVAGQVRRRSGQLESGQTEVRLVSRSGQTELIELVRELINAVISGSISVQIGSQSSQ